MRNPSRSTITKPTNSSAPVTNGKKTMRKPLPCCPAGGVPLPLSFVVVVACTPGTLVGVRPAPGLEVTVPTVEVALTPVAVAVGIAVVSAARVAVAVGVRRGGVVPVGEGLGVLVAVGV